MNWDLTSFKIGEELVKAGLTLLGVLVGGIIAFQTARSGRKEEILFKANFRAFEELSQYFYSIQTVTMRISAMIRSLSIQDDAEIDNFQLDLAKEIDALYDILAQHPKYRVFTLYASEENSLYFTKAVSEYLEIVFAARKINSDYLKLKNSGLYLEAIRIFEICTNTLNTNLSLYVHALFNDQKFPAKKRPQVTLPSKLYRTLTKKGDELYPSISNTIKYIPMMNDPVD